VASHLGDLRSDERTLEVGCGTGEFWHDSGLNPATVGKVAFTDVSPGMVRHARERLGGAFDYAVAATDALPFTTASVDLVIANHMLYHVDDRATAIRELRRVLRESGGLFAATNGLGHLAELDDLVQKAGGGGRGVRPAFWRRGFSLENGEAQLRSSFGTVETYLYDDSLAVTDAGAILAHLGSYMDLATEAQMCIRSIVDDEISHFGTFRIHKNVGLFVAQP
jgi:SAM-dependent methyltransferase